MLTMYIAAASTGDLSGVFLQYGAVGAMLVVLGFFAKTLINREQKRADDLYIENIRLNSLITDKVVPSLIEATTAVRDSQKLLTAIEEERKIERALREQQDRDRRKRGGNGDLA